ncbi:MAG: ATP-binding cassette domain-containing protein [Armatimonadota bacterium]|nr:ATP-binding cassette domain-containing protein [Armatimonadota bacterium]
MIRVRDLTHRFGDNTVLDGVSLDVSEGETVAVMGSSGGGKTTLLRCMAALLEPTSGTVELFGTNVYRCSDSELDAIRQKVGVVFQGSALFDYLSVQDNILFAVKRKKKMDVNEQGAMAGSLLATVGLEGTESLMPSELSGGMRKRVGLARALASEPQILFYDEPTSGLDPVTAYAIDGLIKEIDVETHATSVVVTHDVNSALRVADRVLFIHDGKVLIDAAPQTFVASNDPVIRQLVESAAAEQIH